MIAILITTLVYFNTMDVVHIDDRLSYSIQYLLGMATTMVAVWKTKG